MKTRDYDALIRELHDRVGQLTAVVEQQRHQIEQQHNAYGRRLAQVQTDIAALRAGERVGSAAALAERAPRVRSARRPTHAGRRGESQESSRRALLKWGGAAAAAATVALVANGHEAGAAPANNGDNIVAGQINTATSTTYLEANSGASGTLLVLENNLGSGDGLHVFSSAGNAGIYSFGNGNGDGVQGGTGDPTSNGVFGTNSSAGNGVYGTAATNGNGVQGHAPGDVGYGVWGVADSGYGLVGQSFTGIDIATSGTNRIYQRLQGSAGAPTSGSFNKGEMIRDSNGDLYLCVASGSPGAWKKVAAIPSGTAGGALVFFPAPFRVYDTRPGAGAQGGGGPMSVGQIIFVTITGVVDPANSSIVVPSGATGIIGDLIAITPSGTGFLGIQPHTGASNSRAWVDYQSGVTLHNSVVVGLSGDGKVDVQCSLASSGMGLTITGYII